MATNSVKEGKSSLQNHEAQIEQKLEIPVENVTDMLDAAGTQPSPWGKGYKKLYMMCGLVYLCSTMNGTTHFNIFCGLY